MKKEFPKLFSPYGKTKAEVFCKSLERDPKSILDRISEDCSQPDNREHAVDPDALKNLTADIEKAQKLCKDGEYKKLAWLMFGLGRQTAYLDFWPIMKEGGRNVTGVYKMSENRPPRYNLGLQEVISQLTGENDTFADLKRTIRNIDSETEGPVDCDDYCYIEGEFCWKDRAGVSHSMRLESLSAYFKRAKNKK